MKRTMFSIMTLLVAVVLVGGCSFDGDEGPSFTVASAVVSHETTQDISVWAPDVEGAWPIVFAYHGMGGDRSRWDVTGPKLASQGVLVFAVDYRSRESQYHEQDATCAYRYGMSLVEEYGGDLDQPITFVGHSLGATMVLIGGLNEKAYGPGGTYDGCFTAASMPDVIVPISGCHYENDGMKFGFVGTKFSNQDADLVLVVGTEDEVCEPWQSRDATEALQAVGYNTKFVEIDGADHFTVIFKDLVDGEVLTVPDDPAGDEVVQTILDAIDAARS